MEHEDVPVFIAPRQRSVTIDLDVPATADELEFRWRPSNSRRFSFNRWQNDREHHNCYSDAAVTRVKERPGFQSERLNAEKRVEEFSQGFL